MNKNESTKVKVEIEMDSFNIPKSIEDILSIEEQSLMVKENFIFQVTHLLEVNKFRDSTIDNGGYFIGTQSEDRAIDIKRRIDEDICDFRDDLTFKEYEYGYVFWIPWIRFSDQCSYQEKNFREEIYGMRSYFYLVDPFEKRVSGYLSDIYRDIHLFDPITFVNIGEDVIPIFLDRHNKFLDSGQCVNLAMWGILHEILPHLYDKIHYQISKKYAWESNKSEVIEDYYETYVKTFVDLSLRKSLNKPIPKYELFTTSSGFPRF